MTILPKYAEALRSWMDREKLSLRKAADLLNVNHNSLRNWLTPGAGIHDNQWEKVKPYISVYLENDAENTIPDNLRPSYKLLKKISTAQKAEHHIKFIESFISNYIDTNILIEENLAKIITLQELLDSVEEDNLLQIILPNRSIAKDENAFIRLNDKSAITPFITLETGRDYLPDIVTAPLEDLIFKLIKHKSNPYRAIFWRINDDEESIKYFRHAGSYPQKFTKHCCLLSSEIDKEILLFWIELIDKVFQDNIDELSTFSEKAKNAFFGKKNLLKLHVDFIKDTGGSMQQLIEEWYIG
ncbi:MAG: hypothetical protein NE334_14515 [Lentisphaeraceae bacterium]|nr:hypothetical protein [Lentisphaeraceae bacterium]